jgi:hypothetical protein
MLWKTEDSQLPNNRDVALKRFRHLQNPLKKDKELHTKYQTKIEEYVEKANYNLKKQTFPSELGISLTTPFFTLQNPAKSA